MVVLAVVLVVVLAVASAVVLAAVLTGSEALDSSPSHLLPMSYIMVASDWVVVHQESHSYIHLPVES